MSFNIDNIPKEFTKEFVTWLGKFYRIQVNYDLYKIYHMPHYAGYEVSYADTRNSKNYVFQKLAVYYEEVPKLHNMYLDYLKEIERKQKNDIEFHKQVSLLK